MVARTLNDAVIVPASAVLKSPRGGTTVMVIQDGKAMQTEVETGIREGDVIQITKGLNGSETVIIGGSYGLPDKTRVNVADSDKAGEAKPGGDKD
jgi:multidrug efflux pump subunit AcrA (membrane-fusion protein)